MKGECVSLVKISQRKSKFYEVAFENIFLSLEWMFLIFIQGKSFMRGRFMLLVWLNDSGLFQQTGKGWYVCEIRATKMVGKLYVDERAILADEYQRFPGPVQKNGGGIPPISHCRKSGSQFDSFFIEKYTNPTCTYIRIDIIIIGILPFWVTLTLNLLGLCIWGSFIRTVPTKMAWLVHEKKDVKTESLFGFYQGNNLGGIRVDSRDAPSSKRWELEPRTFEQISNCAKNWKQI